jgi:hypothetical protein
MREPGRGRITTEAGAHLAQKRRDLFIGTNVRTAGDPGSENQLLDKRKPTAIRKRMKEKKAKRTKAIENVFTQPSATSAFSAAPSSPARSPKRVVLANPNARACCEDIGDKGDKSDKRRSRTNRGKGQNDENAWPNGKIQNFGNGREYGADAARSI